MAEQIPHIERNRIGEPTLEGKIEFLRWIRDTTDICMESQDVLSEWIGDLVLELEDRDWDQKIQEDRCY